MPKLFLTFCLLVSFFVSFAAATVPPIVDSRFSDTLGLWGDIRRIAEGMEAQGLRIDGKSPIEAAAAVYADLRCIKVRYMGLFDALGKVPRPDQRLHEGVLICHKDAVQDLTWIFEHLLRDGFPIARVVPSNRFPMHPDPSNGWDDEAIMASNATSCFNFRLKTSRTGLSLHALGKAIDINPRLNPYEAYADRGKFVHPIGAVYHPGWPGTIQDHSAAEAHWSVTHDRVVRYFDQLGWTWAGRWNNPVDYQHFQLSPRSTRNFLTGSDRIKQRFVAFDDGIWAFYPSETHKEFGQAETLIFPDERTIAARLVQRLDDATLRRLLRLKGQQRFEVLPTATWGDWFKDREGQSLDASIFRNADAPPPNPLPPNATVVLGALKPAEQVLADSLAARLGRLGVTALPLADFLRRGSLDADKLNRLSPKAVLVLGSRCSAPYQTIYTAGGFQTLSDSLQLLAYQKMLFGKALERSFALASALAQTNQPWPRYSPPPFVKVSLFAADVQGVYCTPNLPLGGLEQSISAVCILHPPAGVSVPILAERYSVALEGYCGKGVDNK